MRNRKPTLSDLATRLTTVKLIVAGMKDAMPVLAAELRREACESIDDIIADLAATKGKSDAL